VAVVEVKTYKTDAEECQHDHVANAEVGDHRIGDESVADAQDVVHPSSFMRLIMWAFAALSAAASFSCLWYLHRRA